MGVFKDIVTELNLSEEQLKDKQIQKFAIDCAARKQTGDWYQYWNGKIKNFIDKFIIRRFNYGRFKRKIIAT